MSISVARPESSNSAHVQRAHATPTPKRIPHSTKFKGQDQILTKIQI